MEEQFKLRFEKSNSDWVADDISTSTNGNCVKCLNNLSTAAIIRTGRRVYLRRSEQRKPEALQIRLWISHTKLSQIQQVQARPSTYEIGKSVDRQWITCGGQLDQTGLADVNQGLD